MNPEDPEAMRMLDARLGRLHRNLDTSPGFEGRLAARIAAIGVSRPAPPTAEALARLERVHERERREAGRQARMESVVMAIAALGAVLAAWRFAPLLARVIEAYATTAEVAPTLFAAGTLAVAGAALWALLRRSGVEPRSFIGA
jgi:hypothetical protein